MTTAALVVVKSCYGRLCPLISIGFPSANYFSAAYGPMLVLVTSLVGSLNRAFSFQTTSPNKEQVMTCLVRKASTHEVTCEECLEADQPLLTLSGGSVEANEHKHCTKTVQGSTHHLIASCRLTWRCDLLNDKRIWSVNSKHSHHFISV